MLLVILGMALTALLMATILPLTINVEVIKYRDGGVD